MTQPLGPLAPYDEHNRRLEANVHPQDWQNPESERPYHLVVIGAGTAGLVTAAGAAGLGARVALIERELMGGDCLNVGCVPSKGLIRAARVAATVRDSTEFGFGTDDASKPDFAEAMLRMRRLRADISPADSAQRFADLGVDVYLGEASFSDSKTITLKRKNESGELIEDRQLQFKKAVIATGARAAAPAIPGLDKVSYLTNETLFSLTELPRRLGIIGSGPIGAEMAQTFARFGSEVFLIERAPHILPREDRDAAEIVQREFERDGVRLMLNAETAAVNQTPEGFIELALKQNDQEQTIQVDQLLVAVGRAPNTDALNLDTVNVRYDRHGIEVNDQLQTTNPKIFAAGDICSKFKFTHAADFMARIVIQNALFAIGPIGKKRFSDLVIPWATYTSPEIAHVGLYEHEANNKQIAIDTYEQDFSHLDRAILDGQTNGLIKIHTRKGTDQIVGATIVAENAGDLISEITVAIVHKIGLSKLASTIHPYPTQADAIRKLGDQFNRTKLTPTSMGLLNLLRKLNVGD